MGKIAAIFLLLLSVIARAAPPSYVIENLDTLAGTPVDLHGINDRGQIIATSEGEDGARRGWLFDEGVFHSLDELVGNGHHYLPRAINNRGQIVLQGDSEHWLYDGGALTPLGLDPEIFVVNALNDHGTLVGAARGVGYQEQGRQRYVFDAFMLANGKITRLYEGSAPSWGDDSDGKNIGSVATDVNNSDAVVGYFSIQDYGQPVEAFFYKDGKYAGFAGAKGYFTSVPKLNNQDLAIASFFSNAQTAYVVRTYHPELGHPVLWQAGSEHDFDDSLYGRYVVYDMTVRDVNDDDISIGTFNGDFRRNNAVPECQVDTTSGDTAFVADGIEAYDLRSRVLNGREWVGLSPQSINNAGWIIGTGYTKAGTFAAFLLRPQGIRLSIEPVTAGSNSGRSRGGLMSALSVLTTNLLTGDSFDLDAGTVDAASLRVGPHSIRPLPGPVRLTDLDGDGDQDLQLRVRLGKADLNPAAQSLTITGVMLDGSRIYEPAVNPLFQWHDTILGPVTSPADLYPVAWGSLAYVFGCPTAGPQISLYDATSAYNSSSRPILHYDLSNLAGAGGFGTAALVIPLPYSRLRDLNVDVYTYEGDGTLDLNQWDAGELAGRVTVPQGSDWRALTVDITGPVRAAIGKGFATLAVRLQVDPNTPGGLSSSGYSGLENSGHIDGIPGMPVIRFQGRRN